MSSKKRLSRDQKRKQKTAAKKKSEASAVTPYEGSKFQGPEYADILFQAECGIREADEMQDRRLTDKDVRQSLEDLVLHLRGQTGPNYVPDLVVGRIQDHWKEALARRMTLVSSTDLAGILRTIMSSLNVRTHMTPGGRGYLDFLIGFLSKAGFDTQRISAEEAAQLEVIPCDEAAEEKE